jgi:anti-sigma regulatory factor (Ser/Thr protein kinase)
VRIHGEPATDDELVLGADPRNIRMARGFLVAFARGLELPSDTVSLAELALSEIVTNAVVHGEPPIVVAVRATPERLHVSVADAGPGKRIWFSVSP